VSNKPEDTRLITRREFTVESALAMLAGVSITVASCGGDDRTPTAPTPTVVDVNGTVSANHGHTATIMAAQITAGGAISLDIRGQATHPHTVQLTSDELRSIGARTQVTKTSTTNDGHSHSVTFN
jgi:hypothetical protein